MARMGRSPKKNPIKSKTAAIGQAELGNALMPGMNYFN